MNVIQELQKDIGHLLNYSLQTDGQESNRALRESDILRKYIDMVNSGIKINVIDCCLCAGNGKIYEYDESWACPECLGTGRFFDAERI